MHVRAYGGEEGDWKSQHVFTKGETGMTNTIAFYNQMTGVMDGEEQWLPFTLTLGRLLALSPRIFCLG